MDEHLFLCGYTSVPRAPLIDDKAGGLLLHGKQRGWEKTPKFHTCGQ